MEYGTKIRLLYLYQYLLEHTDPDHPQSTAELTKMLKDDYDLKVSRNTISNDLAILGNRICILSRAKQILFKWPAI